VSTLFDRTTARATLLTVSLLLAIPCAAVRAEDVDESALARIHSPPLGLPPVPIPADNPPTAERIALGRKLFFDRRLSRSNTMSCAMCHIPEQGFTNNELATPVGVAGRSVRRNAPTVLNVAYQETMFHDGRDTSLETQVIGPLVARDEMANPSIGYVVAKIANLADYDGLFEAAFGGGATVGRIGQAIASWERSLLAGESAFDRWRYGGQPDALTDRQRRGHELFTGKAGCAACHLIGDDHALFTDHDFHDTGLGHRAEAMSRQSSGSVSVEIAPGVFTAIDRTLVESVGEPRKADLGRYEVSRVPQDLWRFKTPSLRNAALTGPYMHDGSISSLEEVVQFYNAGGVPHDGLDPRIRPLGLSDDEVRALVAFIEALTAGNITDLSTDARTGQVGNWSSRSGGLTEPMKSPLYDQPDARQ
jgi:cytochrome c peroxidase